MHNLAQILRDRAVLNRLLIVWGFALVIGFALWASRGFDKYLTEQMVYSFAISTLIWLFADIGGMFVLGKSKIRFPYGKRKIVFLIASIAGGYILGTLFGDWYSGWSTWRGLETNRFIGMTLLSFAISIGFVGYFYLQERYKQVQLLAAEAQLKLLESQLEPHMLFNTLANLRVLISTDPARATTMLDHMVAYLRATLGGSRATMHPLQLEFDRLRDYLELMTIRMGPRLRYSLKLPPELAKHPVPPLILQPLVENAIKHGLEPKVEGGSIHVVARLEGEQVILEVNDTGVGGVSTSTHADSTAKQGFGLTQVAERLSNTYGALGTISFIAEKQYSTSARVIFPYKNTLS